MLYDMTDGSLTKVSHTTFKDEKVLERAHLQAAVRDHIEVLGTDLLVVAEEFGDFEDAHRRIDLLCLDKAARLVVVELKRTQGGGHMELQALRYAAMVSVMTFEELVTTYARFRQQIGKGGYNLTEARTQLLDWVDEVDDEPVVSREVGIILAAADFSQEITTTVLWLNEFHATDIRCVRLSPYRHDGRLLLDVQQVIPLPEAEELTVRLRRREIEARAAKSSATGGADWTQYVLEYPDGETEPLRKRRAILAMVHALAGVVDTTLIAQTIPQNKLRSVPGTLEGDQLAKEFASRYQRSPKNLGRWFLDEPIHQDGQTWVLSKQWGRQTEAVLEQLAELAPGFGFHDASQR